MTGDTVLASSRKPRVDAERNRLLLLDTAKAAFATKGPGVSLDEIARAAGVGIGTLYRHFPNRDALVEQVYRNETRQLADAATDLAATHAPVAALRQWMLLFVDHLATKRTMAEALNALLGGPSALYAASGTMVTEAMQMLVDSAVESGDIRLDIEPLDLLRAVAGVANISPGPTPEESARRLVDILVAGMRLPDRGA